MIMGLSKVLWRLFLSILLLITVVEGHLEYGSDASDDDQINRQCEMGTGRKRQEGSKIVRVDYGRKGGKREGGKERDESVIGIVSVSSF